MKKNIPFLMLLLSFIFNACSEENKDFFENSNLKNSNRDLSVFGTIHNNALDHFFYNFNTDQIKTIDEIAD